MTDGRGGVKTEMMRGLRLLTLLLGFSLTELVAHTAGVVRGGPLPGPLPLFPPDHWWNVEISTAPVDPNSDAFINFIGRTRGMHPDLGGDTGDAAPNSLIYGIPYIVVPDTQPLEQVVFD